MARNRVSRCTIGLLARFFLCDCFLSNKCLLPTHLTIETNIVFQLAPRSTDKKSMSFRERHFAYIFFKHFRNYRYLSINRNLYQNLYLCIAIYSFFCLFKSLVNLQRTTEAGQDTLNYDDMTFGNKIGLLTGDYLLGHACAELASLRNLPISELISSAVRDFSEAEFVGDRDEQNNPLPYKPGTVPQRSSIAAKQFVDDFTETDTLIPLNIVSTIGNPEKEWEVRHILNAGSLLGKSCQGSLRMAGQSEELQKLGYLFGKHLSLAWQACLDAEPFQSSTLPLDTTFSLIGAPVLFHLEHDPSLYEEIEKGKVSTENIDYHKLHKIILSGPGLERTKELQHKHTTAAMRVLEAFPVSDARTALENIILAMQEM